MRSRRILFCDQRFGRAATNKQKSKVSIGTEQLSDVIICVHNSCRSQIAEALCKHFAGDGFECYSAGTEIDPKINQDAVRLVKQLYGIDMEQTQYSKLLSDIPPVDIVITMGCNVACPYLPCKHREDWGLDDPTGKSDDELIKVIKKMGFCICFIFIWFTCPCLSFTRSWYARTKT